MKTKTRYTIGWIAWLAAFLALEGTALFNRTDGDTLSETTWTWFRVFDAHPSPLFIGLRVALGLFLTWLALHLTFGWNPGHPLPLMETPMNVWKTWLKRDAVNRALRTFYQSVLFTGLVAAADTAVQIVADAVATKAGGGAVDWREVLNAAKIAGTSALFMPLISYLHRLRLDPSSLPSSLPPAPPIGSPTTDPTVGGPTA